MWNSSQAPLPRRVAIFAAGLVATVVIIVLLAANASATLIDPGEFHPNPYERPNTSLGSETRTLNIDETQLEDSDQQVLLDDTTDSTDEDRKDADWCLWSALAGMVDNVAAGESVDDALQKSLEGCLLDHLAGKPEASDAGWVATALTLRDNVELLEALGETAEEASNKVYGGGSIELPTSTWESWFSSDAASVPPV